MLDRLKDRRTLILLVFSLIFFVLVFRLAQITIAEGESYSKKALDMRLKKITQIARRGEIYDRNGKLLAGNGTTLYLEYLYKYKEKKKFEAMALSLFGVLKEKGEKHITLPILLENGKFVYKSDKEKELWLMKLGLSTTLNARETFDYFCAKEGIATELDPYSRQQLLISKGLYLPLGISEVNNKTVISYSHDSEKKKFLESYGFDENLDAETVFKKLRGYFDVSEGLSDEEANYVMILRHYIRNLQYLKYEPIEIAERISEDTAVAITERLIDFPEVSVGIKPYRYYPLKNTCSHILGYMGPISTSEEIAKYTEKEGYNHRDLIGKIGIEASYEKVLHGRRGVTWVDSNVTGEVTGEVQGRYKDERFVDVPPMSGKDVTLTIDSDFQARISGYIQKHLTALQNNDRYVSKYDNYGFDKAYPFARTAAVVAVEVETSEVLAMVSYPDYDVNLFTGGITVEDWMSLQPDNINDPLGPKPMYNMTTMTAVQPGSTFKMVTAFAGLLSGLDPYREINAKGVISMPDGRYFACWIWNMARGSHGPINMINAIAESCNYYFYCIGSGYDYGYDKPLEVDMNAEKIVEAAKIFGLGEPSGVEIDEIVMGVPDFETTRVHVLEATRTKLLEVAEKYIPSHITNNRNLLESKIDQVTEYGVENSESPRYEVLAFLKKTFEIEDVDKLNELTDLLKYSYFNQMGSFDSDAFNLAIGQGRNEYTPAQMARYITTIANGGYLQKLTLIKNVDGVPAQREPFVNIDGNGYIKYLQMGMREAASGISYGGNFANFPIDVAIKTGTAEREGKLSTLDEVEYIEKYCNLITDVSFEEIKAKAEAIMHDRSLLIGNLYTAIDNEKDEFKLSELKKELSQYRIESYLNLGNCMREAIKDLSSSVITDEMIDKYKLNYDNFSWFVAYAPYDKPKIALVIMVPQGGSGTQCIPMAKEILADYFGLLK